MVWPRSMPESTTLVVELSAPRKRVSLAPPGSIPPRQVLKMGTPSITADSCR